LLACAAFLLYTMSEVRPATADADVIIRPRVAHLNANSPFHMQLSLRRGEEAAREALPLIEEVLSKRVPRRRGGLGRKAAS
jgi:hypothetical protein